LALSKAGAGLGVAILALGAVALTRTVRFRSRQLDIPPAPPIALDAGRIARNLSLAIRQKTVSGQDGNAVDETQFAGLHRALSEAFPKVHQNLTREPTGGHSLLFTWKGSDEQAPPILLMAHQDVVPVEPGSEGAWEHPPFAGDVAGGYVWGRGALDDKASLVATLEAVEFLLNEGFKPGRTVYLAYGHDEEVGGRRGAAKTAALLESRGVKPAFVLDEGQAITQGVIQGVSKPVAVIGVAEKGYVTVKLEAKTEGGHSSRPPPQTGVGILSKAIVELEKNQFPPRIAAPVRELLDTVGPEMSFGGRLALANLWLLGGLVERRFTATPSTNALIRTTTAATMFQGSAKENVLPIRPVAYVNFRILPGDDIASVVAHVKSTIDDPRVTVEVAGSQAVEPSPISKTDSEAFALIVRTIRQVFPDAIVAPSLTVGGTDTKHFARLCPNIYRFVPLRMQPSDLARYHGTNERISIDDLANIVRFYVQLLKSAASSSPG